MRETITQAIGATHQPLYYTDQEFGAKISSAFCPNEQFNLSGCDVNPFRAGMSHRPEYWDSGDPPTMPAAGPPAAEKGGFHIIDAVYGPPLFEPLPSAFAHRMPIELQRRVLNQLSTMLAPGKPVFLPAGSLNSFFGDPAPLVTKELRVAVIGHGPHRKEVHVATFNEAST